MIDAASGPAVGRVGHAVVTVPAVALPAVVPRLALVASPRPCPGSRALTASPGARASYDTIRARGTSHHAALRQPANRPVGILHGCLETRTLDDGPTA